MQDNASPALGKAITQHSSETHKCTDSTQPDHETPRSKKQKLDSAQSDSGVNPHFGPTNDTIKYNLETDAVSKSNQIPPSSHVNVSAATSEDAVTSKSNDAGDMSTCLTKTNDNAPPKFVCEVESCRKVFMKEGNLRRHLDQHKPEIVHVCRVCGRMFMWKLHLNVHQKMHAAGGIKGACFCEHCGEHFTNSVKLRVHLLSHRETRHSKGEACSEHFMYEDTFNRVKHAKKPNELATGDNEDEPIFICINCEKTFENKDNLLKHIENYCPQ